MMFNFGKNKKKSHKDVIDILKPLQDTYRDLSIEEAHEFVEAASKALDHTGTAVDALAKAAETYQGVDKFMFIELRDHGKSLQELHNALCKISMQLCDKHKR